MKIIGSGGAVRETIGPGGAIQEIMPFGGAATKTIGSGEAACGGATWQSSGLAEGPGNRRVSRGDREIIGSDGATREIIGSDRAAWEIVVSGRTTGQSSGLAE